MRKVYILALHLAFGGIEKAIISTANLLAERYPVEIISVYELLNAPAFPVDSRVKIRYLLKETPNRAEWKTAVKRRDLPAIIKESVKAVRILIGKKRAVKTAIREIREGVIISTRHEDNLLLSAYGDPGVLKVAQLHHDHGFKKKYIRGFQKGYGRIDVFSLLAPKLADEMRQIMEENRHTKIISIPNFLEQLPEQVDEEKKEKLVLAVGRLTAVKGFDRLISAFALLHEKAPDWQLHIVGEGEERETLEAEIRDHHAAEYITLTGQMDSAGVEQEMRRASIYAMSSFSEAFPFVLLEAQGCFLPCVAYDVRVGPGILIEQEQTGFLIPDGEEAAYVSTLLRLIEDETLRAEMGKKARSHAEDYSRKKIAGMWYALMEEKND